MKKITLIFAGIFSALCIDAQVTDTVSTGAEYVNEVYYNLDSGAVKTVDRAWDIAFQVSGMGSTIRINGGNGIELYGYPNGDTSHWASLDTAGISGWNKYYNSDSLWSKGAFSQTADGMFDLGWGRYNMTTHYVTADSLFVIKLSNGSYKKLWIDKLASSVYYFKYADLDGGNEIHDTLAKADYLNKNFGYYSIENEVEIDREPDNASWDLVFTKYGDFVTPTYFMGVAGVLGNDGISVNEVSGVHSDDADTLGTNFSSSISAIGYDWKTLNYGTGLYTADDSLTYFVSSNDGDLWKIVFTAFERYSGNYVFNKEKLVTSSIDENATNLKVATYPNPATDYLNIVLHQNNSDDLNVTVFNLSGSLVYSRNFPGTSGINNLQLGVGEFSKGLYIVNVQTQGASVQTKFVVK